MPNNKSVEQLLKENKNLKFENELLNSGYSQLKETTRKLKENEDKFSKAFNISPSAMVISDLKEGDLIDVNNAFSQITGYSISEALGSSTIKLKLWNDINDRQQMVSDLLAGRKVLNKEYLFRKKNGEVIICTYSAKIIDIKNKPAIIASITDISKRKKYEKELSESQEKFRSIINVSPIPMALNDENENITFLNPAFIHTFGYSQKDIPTLSRWWQNAYPDSKYRKYVADNWQNKLNQNKQKGTVFRPMEVIVKCKNGTDRTVIVTAAPLIGTFENVHLIVMQDVTSLKKIENELRDSEYFFKESQAAGAIGSYKTNFVTGFWESSAILNRIFGIDKKYIRNIKGWNDLIYSEDKQMMSTYLVDFVQKQGQPFNKEYRIIKKNDGKVLWVNGTGKLSINYQGKVISMVGTIQDITARKTAQLKVIEVLTRDEAILNSIGDAVVACDQTGKILLFNQIAQNLTGISSKNAIGQHYKKVLTFVREIDEEPVNDFISQAINNNIIAKMANHILLVTKTGNKIPVANSAAPIKVGNDSIIGCVVAFHDVTQERQIDKAKTQFVSMASHQLRTPLSTINWYSEMLLSQDVGTLTEKQTQYTKEVYNASQRMVELVNSLLNVSRLELGTFAIEPKITNLKFIVRSCLKELAPQIQKQEIIVKKKYGKDISHLMVDPKLVTMIITNYLSNSVKYSKKQGRMTISVCHHHENILISVADNGIGIPTSQQKEIYEKLYRSDNAKKTDPNGTGLGLYIVKEIITYLGGKAWFKSKVGKGSTFYVTFPLSGMLKKAGDKQLI